MTTTSVQRSGRLQRNQAGGEKATGAMANRRGRTSKFLQLVSKELARNLKNFGDHVSLVDVAEIFGVTTQTARKWVNAGWLPQTFLQEGDRRLYMRTSDVIANINTAIDGSAS